MAVIIGSARHGENYDYYNGRPGDQEQYTTPDRSGEVAMENFYVHQYGWYILRLKNDGFANKIAERMKVACNNPNIGYSMNLTTSQGRYGVIAYGTDAKVKCNADCSSLVRQCFKEATGYDPGDFSTAGEAYALEATGLVKNRISYTSGTTLYTGDILVSKQQGHTVIVTDGAARGNTPAPAPTPTPTPTPKDKISFTYAVRTSDGVKWPEVTDLNDYAGVDGRPITDIKIKASKGSVRYRVHILGGEWLPWVTGYDWNNDENGYAGDHKPIDMVQVFLKSPDGTKLAKYRVRAKGNSAYYAWQLDDQQNYSMDGYAGLKGKAIDRFQIYAE